MCLTVAYRESCADMQRENNADTRSCAGQIADTSAYAAMPRGNNDRRKYLGVSSDSLWGLLQRINLGDSDRPPASTSNLCER